MASVAWCCLSWYSDLTAVDYIFCYYEFIEAENMRYTIRLPATRVLQDKIGHLLTRLVGASAERGAAVPCEVQLSGLLPSSLRVLNHLRRRWLQPMNAQPFAQRVGRNVDYVGVMREQ